MPPATGLPALLTDASLPRRAFLGRVALTGASLLGLSALAACNDDANITGFRVDATLDFASDTGVLNYLYLLEQVEAEFSRLATASGASDLTAADRTVLAEVRDHELVHRDVLRAWLGADAIAAVSVQFPPAIFASRSALLSAARDLEDLVTEAYIGAAPRLTYAANVAFVAKIASVEARHAAVMGDMLSPGTTAFATDTVISEGLERSLDVRDVLAAVSPLLARTVEVRNLA